MRFCFFVYVCILLSSCTSDKNQLRTIQSNVDGYLKENGNAGEGYAFVGITDIDTVTEKEFLDRQIESVSVFLMNKNSKMRQLDSFEMVIRKSLSVHPDDQTLLTNLQDITRTKTALYTYQHKQDSLKAMIRPEQSTQVKFIGMDYAFTSKDASGVSTLHHYYVKLDEQLNVLSVMELQK